MHKTTADQHPRGALRVISTIPPEQKNRFLRCSAYLLNTAGAKTRQVALREIPLSVENPNTAGATLSGTPLLQRALELRRRSLILLRCPPEQPLSEMVLWRGAPAVFFHHAGANCSVGNPHPTGNPGLIHTQTDTILKKFD
jgi:hypothetical protein